jgi:hypothetical protein
MTHKPVFLGLIVDEKDRPVGVTYVGGEPFYVVDDDGFHRHIPSEQVDLQVLEAMREMIAGHEDLITDQTAKMLGQDDIFSRAMIETQIKNMDRQFENLLETGLPEEGRAYMGMIGFKIRINLHGEVIDIEQPGMVDPGDGE